MSIAETVNGRVWGSGGLPEVETEAHEGPLQAFPNGLQLKVSKFWSCWSGRSDLEVPYRSDQRQRVEKTR